MDEYKYSEDCFHAKEKFDELIEQVPGKNEYESIQNFNIFIDQFHNCNQNSMKDLPKAFKYANDYIQYFPDRKKDTLIQAIECSPLCSDIISYFQDKCQDVETASTIPESYFGLVDIITKKTSFFSDCEEYFSFIFILLDNYDLFPDNIKNIINTIIISIIKSCKNPELLVKLYDYINSPDQGELFSIAIGHITQNDFGVKTGAQNVIKNLYDSLIFYSEDPEKAADILSIFFNKHKQNEYYKGYSYNDEFIIHISIAALNKFPELYTIIYDDNRIFFQKLFSHLVVDENLSYFAFHLITLIIQNFTREDPPDLDFILDWGNIINFFIQRKKNYCSVSNFKKMLLFSAAYLRFGSAFFDKFSSCGFFDHLVGMMNENGLTFSESTIAAKCLSNAIFYSKSPTQIYYLFHIGVLPVFLTVLENDSDEDLTHEILVSIHLIYDVCKNAIEMQIEEIPPNAADIFTTCFAEESGYDILMGLKTCADEAQHLNELIGDPPGLLSGEED